MVETNQSQRDRSDFEFLLANAQIGKALGLSYFTHLEQPIGIWNYIRIADDIEQHTPTGDLLDWGAGYGQMTYLLKRRGFNVTAFDIGDPDRIHLPDIPLCRQVDVIRTTHPTKLPFEGESFDVALSCGVLEHVNDDFASLCEIARVLRPGGYLLIYQLPQLYSWQEAVIRHLRLGYAHPRRYTAAGLAETLKQAGYSVQRIRRANMIPKNLTGMPERLRTFYSRFSRTLINLDGVLCRMPGVNHFAGVLEVNARRETGLTK